MSDDLPRIVTFDLMSEDPDYYFILTTALGDFAADCWADVKDGGPNAAANTRWAEAAEDMLARIETALATIPEGAGS